MIVQRNKIKLVRLTEEYIEMVRQKRNLPEIQKTMEYRQYITSEMQAAWFSSINNIYNYFFLIEVNNSFIGLINISQIEWSTGIINNAGIFIWEQHFLQSPEVSQASLLITDLVYSIGIQKNYIRILNNNTNAIHYNKALGYRLLPGQENTYNQKYEQTAEMYFNAIAPLRTKLGLGTIYISLAPKEYIDLAEVIDWHCRYINNVSFTISVV